MKRVFGMLFAALLAAALSLSAAVTPEQLKAQSALATTERFPNAETVLLYDWQSAVYQADGTGVETDDFYQKILTETGRESPIFRQKQKDGTVRPLIAELSKEVSAGADEEIRV